MNLETSRPARRTLANGFAIFGGEAFSRLATVVMAVLVARRFGATALGQYGYALALASVLLLVPDLGLHLVTTRDLAAEPGKLRRVFWSLHWLKLILSGGVAAFTVLFGQWVIQDEGRRFLLYVLVARTLLQTFSQATMSVFKAFERMHYIVLQQFVNAALVILWALAALELRANLVMVVAAFLLGQAVETWMGWRIVRHRFRPGEIYGWDTAFLGQMLFAAAPIGLTALLQALNLRLDILILGLFAANQELGRFQAAAWFLIGTFLFGSLLMTVLFPKLSKLLRAPSEKGSAYVGSLLKHGTLLMALGSFVVWLLAPYLLRLLFGSGLGSAASLLRILAAALPMMFMNTVMFYVFVAARRRAVVLGTLLVGTTVGAVLTFVLSSNYGASGAALADLVREFVVTAVSLYFLERERLAAGAGLAFLKVSFSAAILAILVRAFGGPLGLWIQWPEAWTLLMLGGTLLFVGWPNRQEIFFLASDNP